MDLLSLHHWVKEEGLARRTTSHHHAWVHAPGDGTIQWRSGDVLCTGEFNLSGRQACETLDGKTALGCWARTQKIWRHSMSPRLL